MDRELIARELVEVARTLVALDEVTDQVVDDIVDETFRTRLMNLRAKLPRLAPRKAKRLRSMGVETMLRPNMATVEDLVMVVEQVVAGA